MADQTRFSEIPFKMHPRVFAALGADLVTSDVVAIIELVKNSYDALATNVWVRLLDDAEGNSLLEIEDDGCGMDRATIEDVWCTVATPFRRENRVMESGNIKRRVSGEKGLGRLSIGRLGEKVTMFTKAERTPCWEVNVDWSSVSDSARIDACAVQLREAAQVDAKLHGKSGTLIRVSRLKGLWDEAALANLQDNLARLLSPFKGNEDFRIYLSTPTDSGGAEPTAIVPEKFLSKPKYLIKGKISSKGDLNYRYVFKPIDGNESRRTSGSLTWKQIVNDLGRSARPTIVDALKPVCGAFDFELRVWDLGSEDSGEIAEAFGIRKSQIRKAIRAHKGISVYRDGILVVPKSDSARDWLGLDLKRISKLGDRISTSQIVGYVGISADGNPRIVDTSDRERFVQNEAYEHFEILLYGVVKILENHRRQDQSSKDGAQELQTLFSDLLPDEEFLENVSDAADKGDTKRVIALLKAHQQITESTVKNIQKRFFYYSHLATVGSISETIIHEIRSRTGIISYFLRNLPTECIENAAEDLRKTMNYAVNAVDSLEGLADRFSPLASHKYKRGKRSSIAEEHIEKSIDYSRDQIQAAKVDIIAPGTGNTCIAVDPAEFEAILINLLSNALFWVQKSSERVIEVEVSSDLDLGKARVSVHDSGQGVSSDDAEKIFLPGVTRRPSGIGMGLTVAGELVAAYGGKLRLEPTGKYGGASFSFELPLSN